MCYCISTKFYRRITSIGTRKKTYLNLFNVFCAKFLNEQRNEMDYCKQKTDALFGLSDMMLCSSVIFYLRIPLNLWLEINKAL